MGRIRTTRWCLGAVAVVLALTGCGADPGPGDDAGPWSTQRLGTGAVALGPPEYVREPRPMIGVSGDDVLVLTVDDDSTVRSYRSAAGGEFVAGTPFTTVGSEYGTGTYFPVVLDRVRLDGVVPVPGGGWLVVGVGFGPLGSGTTGVPLGLYSADGLTWRWRPISGLPVPLTVTAVALVDGRVVVAGQVPASMDPHSRTVRAGVWTSTDGVGFAGTYLSQHPDSAGAHVVEVTGHGDRLRAFGVEDGETVAWGFTAWASDDAGRTWRGTPPTAAPEGALHDLAVEGDLVLAVGGTGAGAAEVPPWVRRSTDGGTTWTATGPAVAGDRLSWERLWAAGGRFWARARVDYATRARPEACYADLSQCDPDVAARVATSTDGESWTTVDVPGHVHEVVGTADGRVLVLGSDGGEAVVRTLAAGTEPPEGAQPGPVRTTDLVLLPETEAPRVGVRYDAPLPIHCGLDGWVFGDSEWTRTDDGPDVEIELSADPPVSEGPVPDGWPLAGNILYGHATLTEDGTLEYSRDDGEVIATYRRGHSSWCD